MKNIFELEVWRDNLQRLVSKKLILDSIVSENSLVNLSITEFKSKIIGKYFNNVKRIGSLIVLEIGLEDFFVLKIASESELLIKREVLDSSTKLLIKYEDFSMHLRDKSSRTIMEYAKYNVYSSSLLKDLGLDVQHLDYERFVEICREHDLPIKKILTDHAIISGLSSLDTDEILFNARIHPERNTKSLNILELNTLYRSIYEYLSTSINNTKKEVGRFFSNPSLDWVNVYGRKDKSCKISGDLIKQINVEGFESYYCPGCQK